MEIILDEPEDIQRAIDAYEREEEHIGKSLEIRLKKIIPLSNNQYILYFLKSPGLHTGSGVHFLFSIQNGISEEPLYLTRIRQNSLSDISAERFQADTPFVGGDPLFSEDINGYFYFTNGSTRTQYSDFKYSLQNEQLVLEEQIIGVRSVIPIQFEDALNTASVMNSHPVTERMTSSVISDSTVFTL